MKLLEEEKEKGRRDTWKEQVERYLEQRGPFSGHALNSVLVS